MHIIQDLEAFIKEMEDTVYAWFGTGINGEQGKDALKAVIDTHVSPVITGTLTRVEAPIPDEQPDAQIPEPTIEGPALEGEK